MIDPALVEQEVDELVHGAENYGRLQGNVAYLEHMRKVVIALEKRAAQEDNPKLTDGKADDVARTSERYRKHLVLLGEATAKYEAARARREGIKLRAALLQTFHADARTVR